MHEVEGATWCEPRKRDGRLRQAGASPVCAQSGDACDRGTDTAGNVVGAAPRIVEGTVARSLRQPQPEQGAATGSAFAAGTGINGISEYIFRYSIN